MQSWLNSLKFQVAAMLLALTGSFVVSSYYVLNALRIEREDDALLRLGSEMRLISQQLVMQAMHYKENAPRDYQTYSRDLHLYYRDLQDQLERMTGIANTFSADPKVDQEGDMIARFDVEAYGAAKELSQRWSRFDKQLRRRVGDDPQAPRLEKAAEFIIENGDELQAGIARFWAVLEASTQGRAAASERLYRYVLAISAFLTAIILLWFFVRVLRPLGNTMQGVRRIGAGDFGHRIPIETNNEIGALNAAFNRLSSRLHALLRLLTRLQGGSDLDETLGVVADISPDLIPVDWTGILFLSPDGYAQLECAYLDRVMTTTRLPRFPLVGTPLESALNNHKPLHVPDVHRLASASPRFSLLRHLDGTGMRDAIFLPINEQNVMPGILAFASRKVDAYSADRIALLSNLALLITLSFGRTFKLVERARLAAIGQFASAIAHEIRNPLATITLALDYLKSTELPGNSTKRIELASSESSRIARLLDDILLYAKPMVLKVVRVRLSDVIGDLMSVQETILGTSNITIIWPPATSLGVTVEVDADRLKQVLINLLQNAVDASEPGSQVRLTMRQDLSQRQLAITVENNGPPLPDAHTQRLFQPFFSTKPEGTGLGLSIVQRIVHAHGGDVVSSYDDAKKTMAFTVLLPLDESPR